jgi:hypothetical protein
VTSIVASSMTGRANPQSSTEPARTSSPRAMLLRNMPEPSTPEACWAHDEI